jgi:hypothetical protein
MTPCQENSPCLQRLPWCHSNNITSPTWVFPRPVVSWPRMQKIKHYPTGYPLLVSATDTPTRRQHGIKIPMAVYYDPPYKQPTLKGVALSDPPVDGSNMLMRFPCHIAGAPAVAAADSQASHCFLSRKFVQKHALATTPFHRMVELANGSHAQLTAQCYIKVLMPARDSHTYHIQRLHCLVVDLGEDHDLILGQNWMKKEGAILNYENNTIAVRKQGAVLDCIPETPVPGSKNRKESSIPRISAAAVRLKRDIRRGARCFLVKS